MLTGTEIAAMMSRRAGRVVVARDVEPKLAPSRHPGR
jgi:hypothetical protein